MLIKNIRHNFIGIKNNPLILILQFLEVIFEFGNRFNNIGSSYAHLISSPPKGVTLTSLNPASLHKYAIPNDVYLK
jgi:hypothetical protein